MWTSLGTQPSFNFGEMCITAARNPGERRRRGIQHFAERFALELGRSIERIAVRLGNDAPLYFGKNILGRRPGLTEHIPVRLVPLDRGEDRIDGRKGGG